MNDIILRMTQIKKQFIQGQEYLEVLKTVDLSVAKGEAIAIMGPSGAGKTTLLSIAGGLMQPTAGSVQIAGEELYQQSDENLSRCRNLKVGFVFQMHHLLPEFNSAENVALPAMIRGESKTQAMGRGRELLDQVGLGARWNHRPGELSGGEQQRVAIARALINRPEVLLADEPTGDLDEATAQDLHRLFVKLNRDFGQTFIVVTHNPQLAKMADRIIVLKAGRIESETRSDQEPSPGEREPDAR